MLKHFIRTLHSSSRRLVPTDSLCIPLSPPYSLAAHIPPPTPLPRETLLKLHRLAALVPPATEKEWAELDDLGGLVAIMEGVREFHPEGKTEGMVDARVRGVEAEILSREEEPGEKGVLEEGWVEMAKVRDGAYFVVRTPEGIRGKVRAGKVEEEDGEEP